MKSKFSLISVLIILLISASSCVMDGLHDTDEIGEGTANVTAEISFDQLTPALTRATSGGTSGSAINDMTSICVLLYKLDGSVLTDNTGKPLKYYFSNVQTEISGQDKPSDEVDTGNPESGHWAQTSETSTVKATVNLPDIPYGKYKIYAIANVPNTMLTEEVISDIEEVKKLHFAWNKQDIAANSQMFGYFSENNTSSGFEAPLIAIKQPNQKLHAWVKRLTSKVTVAFDGRNLKDDINIYLISATIKDIPENCYLGQDNSPGLYTPAENEMNKLIKDSGQTIMYVDDPEGTPLDSWPAMINKDNPVFGFNTVVLNNTSLSPSDKLAAQHGESVNALYFFENLQGNGVAGTESDKWQVVTGSDDKTQPTFPNGNNPDNEAYKDAKKFGSYIEVQAYYISNNPENISRGEITYRFMLGKDTHTDFNAERNHHFKVTLCFNGYANDVDWHIVFDQEPAIVGTTPNYISYLYNHSMNYKFDVVGGELISLVAEIKTNDITEGSWHPKDGEVTAQDEAVAEELGGSVYWTGNVYFPGPWNGFLSLRKSTVAEYGGDVNTNRNKFVEDNLGYRGYDVSEGEHDSNDQYGGKYTITKSGLGVTTVTVPLFTRPRVMVATTGYTGNNPYVAYNRESQVEFTAEVKKADGTIVTVYDTIHIIQSRRIVNPKAVWRKAGSTNPFHVQLKIMESQTSESFSNLISFGPWKAEVVVGKDWINLTQSSNSVKNPDGSVTGTGNQYDESNQAGRTVDFYLAPNGATTKPRGGIIRVTYHNNSCVHNIFVRQGYEPVEFYGNGTMWHTGNLLTGGTDTDNAQEVSEPQFEGSYFRLYNRQYPIDASSNTVPTPFRVVNGMDKYFNIAGTNPQVQKKWDDIRTTETAWGTFKVDNISCRLPKKADWEAIINNSYTTYGYGVLYGDAATETKESITEAYGADPDHLEYGMRGVIVCDENSGTQIFLPIAASGYGRFKQYTSNNTGLPSGYGGSVLYATRFTWYSPLDQLIYRPLFYDIFLSQGTIYWLYDTGSGYEDSTYKDNYCLDINYFTLGFSLTSWYDQEVAPRWPDKSGSDAIHIRLVHDK